MIINIIPKKNTLLQYIEIFFGFVAFLFFWVGFLFAVVILICFSDNNHKNNKRNNNLIKEEDINIKPNNNKNNK